jgi:peptide/nickel transport system permease protein
LAPAAALARIVRVEAIRVLAQDYMLAARAKRLSRWRRYLVHALPNCMTATLTAAGLIFGGLLTGTVLVENVFAWPGIGSTLVLSILQKDFPLTQGLILTFGLLVLLTNLAVDLLIALIDPRTGLRR